MAKKKLIKKTTQVRSFPRKVPVSKKNPEGKTIVRTFVRHFNGLDLEEIQNTTKTHSRKGISFPTSRILAYTNADKLADQNGEVKNFAFKNIRLKDLYNPEIAIPLAVRWIFRKRDTATHALNRSPTTEELILDYKGLLKSSTKFRNNALESFRKNYAKLTKS